MRRDRWSAVSFALFVLVACRDEQPSSHVYSSPPPRPPKVAAGAASPNAPEGPIGAEGAEARIIAVFDAATGSPIALNTISGPIEVMTLVARGPGRPPSENARVELVLHGGEEAIQTLALDAPAPTIVAHSFSVPVAGDGRTGLRAGRYTVQVRIVGGDGRVLASSVPLYVELPAKK